MSLRVAGKIAPASVVTFAKGVTLGCMLRLVWHDFAKQRGSRMKCQQTLDTPLGHDVMQSLGGAIGKLLDKFN
jgi:hypothetical protein